MDTRKLITGFVIVLLLLPTIVNASHYDAAKYLKLAYPEHVKDITDSHIIWHDGTMMQLGETQGFSSFFRKKSKKSDVVISEKDIVHARYEPFFKKMYGNSPREVRSHLVTVYWMPNIFGKRYPLKVTTVNGVDEKIRRISARLEQLPPEFHKYLKKPGGSFYWRNVKGESSLSTHSFGIAIDINLRYSNYWLWDYLKLKKPIADLRNHHLTLNNRIPKEIIQIFEDEGFFWGGHWYFYDTMHFEYRPDLLLSA